MKYEEMLLSSYLLISEVLEIQLLLHSASILSRPIPPPSHFTQYTLSLSSPQKFHECPVEHQPDIQHGCPAPHP